MKVKSIVILVNWNGWRDTLACLESLRHLDHPAFEVVVVDNGSTDESLDRIRAWAAVTPTVALREYDRVAAEAGGDRLAAPTPGYFVLTLVRSGTNLGFSGGNNTGIRYARARDVRYVWLLNNDTTVAPDSLARLEAAAAASNDRALVSSWVSFMGQPERWWFEGGVYHPWTASATHVDLAGFTASRHPYLTGCALLIPVRVMEEIGLLDESIFLYAEDVDYSIRASRAGIPLRVAGDSIVRHAVSGSAKIGSPQAYRLHVRNFVWVMRKHYGESRLLGIVPYHLAKLLSLVLFRHRSARIVMAYLSGLFDGAVAPTPRQR